MNIKESLKMYIRVGDGHCYGKLLYDKSVADFQNCASKNLGLKCSNSLKEIFVIIFHFLHRVLIRKNHNL